MSRHKLFKPTCDHLSFDIFKSHSTVKWNFLPNQAHLNTFVIQPVAKRTMISNIILNVHPFVSLITGKNIQIVPIAARLIVFYNHQQLNALKIRVCSNLCWFYCCFFLLFMIKIEHWDFAYFEINFAIFLNSKFGVGSGIMSFLPFLLYSIFHSRTFFGLQPEV